MRAINEEFEMTDDEFDEFMRADCHTFVQRCFQELNPQQEFLDNWHLEVMSHHLSACGSGDMKRLIVNIPPRHLKSISSSVALVAWLLGHDPSAQIICASYGQDLADKHARDCRQIMTSVWYQALFPDTRLSPKKQSVNEFETTRGGFRLATSVGGVLTGRGADLIIIDDPLKPDEALSDTQRSKVNDWFDHSLYSRLNNKETGRIIIIMQRLHEDDLVGHVLETGQWNHLCFPAIAEADEHYDISTVYGRQSFVRLAGEVLHPERESREALDRLRLTLGAYHFAGQYQQAPAPAGGGIIRIDWFRRFSEPPTHFDKIIQSWDTANKADELANYSACTTWGIKEVAKARHIYLLHVLRKQVNYPELKRMVREQNDLWQVDVILIEDKASGTQLIQELIHEGLSKVKPYKPEGDKIMRLHAQTAAIENGFVHIPAEASWLADYEHELMQFPNGKYNDQVDSTAQALDWIKQSDWFPGAGFLKYIEMQMDKREPGPGSSKVRMKAPQNTAWVHVDSRSYQVGPDGIAEIYEVDSWRLIGNGWERLWE